ncbi:hypothetical protein Y032_0046g1368 [Ancylostoma ceylanicum]|uniref:Uncharacterized protein n=1 Tax=Ancylostoma ceylanicum TaxID=53326 RepID=A0A016UC13_9BILA|nr:hypothetical protein Y032_0046g1368 [Ancylostoma ceylanicum]
MEAVFAVEATKGVLILRQNVGRTAAERDLDHMVKKRETQRCGPSESRGSGSEGPQQKTGRTAAAIQKDRRPPLGSFGFLLRFFRKFV